MQESLEETDNNSTNSTNSTQNITLYNVAFKNFLINPYFSDPIYPKNKSSVYSNLSFNVIDPLITLENSTEYIPLKKPIRHNFKTPSNLNISIS